MSNRDYWQDRRLDAAVDQLDQQHRAADDATIDSLTSLAQQIAVMKQELLRQSAAISALTQTLMEHGAVDGAQLKARFDAAMGEAQAQANRVACARCRKQVDKRGTQITSSGAVCDACYVALSADE